jgi:hypothetical protein
LKTSLEDTQKHKEQFLEVYSSCKSVQEAAEKIGVTKKCAYEWIKDDEILGIEFLARRALEKFAPVERIIEEMGRVATDHTEKVSMPTVATQQYLLNVRAPNIFGKYKEQRKEGKVTRMTVRKDKGNGKVETEEYNIEEATLSEANGN